ncbi:MAG: UdgX family uracil-DNA binding protein [Hasllibacter sp.]
MHLALPRIGTWDAFRDELRRITAAGVPPQEVSWSRGAAEAGLDLAPPPDLSPVREVRAPKAFAPFARTVAHHSDPERFALLHLLLDRLQSEKGLMEVRTDPLLTRLHRMEKAVRRDLHKMHAFVRFREVDGAGSGKDGVSRRAFAAWFEPDHPIVEPGAVHFARRFADMDWTIATPDLTAVFEDGALRIEDADPGPPPAEDATQALWDTYFLNIFNPARLKPKAMLAEMPKKYWRNLSEARLIPDMIAGAERRVHEMREAAPTLPPARAAAIAAQLEERGMDDGPGLFGHNSLAALNADAAQRYPRIEGITQLVPGEGPVDADLMVVGEQPGDQEDLAGRPFVGPAGQLFDRLAEKAGLPRDRVYVTNATKHFKYEPRGKFRMHKTPTLTEIKNVRWWLDEERALIAPKMILAMGGSAAYALTGNKKDMLKRRSSVETAMGGAGEPVFITVHPSFLLRLPDEEGRAREQGRFVDDLKRAWEMVEAA